MAAAKRAKANLEFVLVKAESRGRAIGCGTRGTLDNIYANGV